MGSALNKLQSKQYVGVRPVDPSSCAPQKGFTLVIPALQPTLQGDNSDRILQQLLAPQRTQPGASLGSARSGSRRCVKAGFVSALPECWRCVNRKRRSLSSREWGNEVLKG